jgi:PhnB protein
MKMNPYLNFNGKTEEAFNFYRSVFGGEFITLQRFKDTPEAEKLNDADKDKIMHVSLPIGDGNMLMATDMLESMGQTLTKGNNYSICISAENTDEAERVFNGLAEGGTIAMPLEKTFWGSYFGMVNDRFGIQWMIDCPINQNS